MFFGTDKMGSTARVVQRSRLNFLREAQIWYNRQPEERVLTEDFENVIVLSDEFYEEIIAHPIPTDLEAVKVLAAAPAVLELFMWLTYRCFVAKGSEAIPIFGPYGLATQNGSVEYSRERRFVAGLEQWLGTVRALWPACPARITREQFGDGHEQPLGLTITYYRDDPPSPSQTVGISVIQSGLPDIVPVQLYCGSCKRSLVFERWPRISQRRRPFLEHPPITHRRCLTFNGPDPIFANRGHCMWEHSR